MTGITGKLKRHIRHDIYRIGHDEQRRLLILLHDLRYNTRVNLHIFMDQIEPCLSRLLICSRCDNDHGTIRDILIASGLDFHRLRKRQTMA